MNDMNGRYFLQPVVVFVLARVRKVLPDFRFRAR